MSIPAILSNMLQFANPILVKNLVEWYQDPKATLSTGMTNCLILIAILTLKPMIAHRGLDYGFELVSKIVATTLVKF